MKIGSTNITAVYIGSTAINKVYIGSTEIWTSFTGLLDLYPNAAAAYSLRKLRSAYTGSAIRVRRASDNTEQDIGFVNNELDTSTLTTFCSGTNGFVKTWYDQSGNGRDATQATAANQPQIVSSGSTILENGKPSLSFDGEGGLLPSFTYYLYNNNTITISNDLSVFATITPTRNPSTQDAVWVQLSSLTNSDDEYFAAGFRDGGHFTRLRTTASLIGNGLDTSSTSQILYSNIWDYSEDTNSLIINTTTGTDLNNGRSTNSGTNPIVIGARPDGDYSANINLQELIVYPSDQSTNRTGISTNINTNYNIYWDGSQTSLLDTYGGSAAAYSLRALSSAYTGPLVRVRRASDNAEQDIYAKYDGTLNVSALESFCSGTNGFVKTWYDQSGNGDDATQTTAASQPQIVSSGSVIEENGKPAISKNSSYLRVPFLLNTQYKTFVVLKNNGATHTLFGSFSSSDISLTSQNSTNTTFYQNATNNALRRNANLFQPTNRQGIFNALINQSLIYEDTTYSFSPTSNGIGYATNIFNAGFFQLQEIIIYPSTNTEITGIEGNINDFYSIY